MDKLKLLTADILKEIQNGWRVGIEENNAIHIFEVVSRLGNALKADEKWIMHRKDADIEDGPVTGKARCFFDLDLHEIQYCHSKTTGYHYISAELADHYE